MIINVRASSSVDFGNYLTNRDKKAFTIIEGDPLRIDTLASLLLADKTKRKNTHYSFVLSFKEEHLNKDELFNYYMQFKELMFKNYSSDELEILSVIHWDDAKPHIHCTVLNASQLDDNRDLRLYRGYVDFKRVEAVQEKINYENNLASPLNNFNLLSLTNEQQTRDWLVKKEKPFYKVFDDTFFRVVEDSIKKSKDFSSFIGLIEKEFGGTAIHSASKFKKDEFNKNKLLNEYALVLKDKFLPTGQNHIYNSKLFDKKWFEKNLSKIQDSLSRVRLENIKFSAERKSLKEYNRILEETTQKHAEHILARRVGKEYVRTNIDRVLEENLALFRSGSLDFLNKDICESIVEKFLANCDAGQIEKFTAALPYSFEIKDDFIRVKKNDDESFDIYNQNLFLVLKEKSVSSRNSKEKGFSFEIENNKKIEIGDFEECLKDLASNKNKARFRELLLKYIEKERIKSLQEFEALAKKLGLRIKKSGADFKRGDYVTLENSSGSVSVYDSFLAFMVKNKVFLEETDYFKKRDGEIENEILNRDINYYLKSVYCSIMEEKKIETVECVDDFRLYKADYIGSVVEENGFIFTQSYLDYAKFCKNSYERVADNRAGELLVEKSLDKRKTGANLADFYFQRGIEDISIDNNNFDSEIKEGMINRAKEMNYSLYVFDSSPNYLEGNSLLFSNKGEVTTVSSSEKLKAHPEGILSPRSGKNEEFTTASLRETPQLNDGDNSVSSRNTLKNNNIIQKSKGEKEEYLGEREVEPKQRKKIDKSL